MGFTTFWGQVQRYHELPKARQWEQNVEWLGIHSLRNFSHRTYALAPFWMIWLHIQCFSKALEKKSLGSLFNILSSLNAFVFVLKVLVFWHNPVHFSDTQNVSAQQWKFWHCPKPLGATLNVLVLRWKFCHDPGHFGITVKILASHRTLWHRPAWL